MVVVRVMVIVGAVMVIVGAARRNYELGHGYDPGKS